DAATKKAGDELDQKLIDLSGGLKRRVQVAKVFMVDKPLVFLDEATTGMDPINKRATLEAIREQARKGRTIFLTTHILQEAEELCDSVAIIEKGKCVASGDLHTIKALIERVFDISITFTQLTEGIVQELERLSVLKLTRNKNTVEMSVKGDVFAALEALGAIARNSPDVFVSLLGGAKQ
ncbi:MAG: ATP-binding cassette domain-containing protein, partial [Bacteroidota bacterium]